MLAWVVLMPILAAMVAAMVLPALPWLRLSVRSLPVAIAASPAVTLGMLLALSQVFHLLHIPWGPITLVVLALIWLAGAVVFRWRVRHRPDLAHDLGDSVSVHPPLAADAPGSRIYRILGRKSRWGLLAVILIGWLIAALPLVLTANPADPPQQWDSTFHLNGVWNLLQTRDAAPSVALAALYGGQSVLYPVGWHTFVALFAVPSSVVQVANTSNLLIMGLWVVGCTALVSVISSSRAAVVAAAVLSGCTLDMPADALTMYSQWPHALGVSMLPGLAAFAVVEGRRLVRDTEPGLAALRGHAWAVVVLALGALGLVSAHPSALFAMVALLIVPVLASLWSLIRRSAYLKDSAQAVWWAVGAIVVIAVPLLALETEQIKAMGRYPRYGTSLIDAIAHAFTPYPPFSNTIGLAMTVAVTGLLCLLGAVTIVVTRQRWDNLVSVDYPDWKNPFVFAKPATAEGEFSAPADSAEGGTSSAANPDALNMSGVSSAENRAGVDSRDKQSAPDAMGDAALMTSSAGGSGSTDISTDKTSTQFGLSTGAGSSKLVDTTRSVQLQQEWTHRRIQIRDTHGPRPLVWPLGTFLVMGFLTFVAWAPWGDFRQYLLAPWYLDPRRIMAYQDIAIVMVAAVGVDRLISWLRSQRVRTEDQDRAQSAQWRIGALLGAFLVLLTLGGGADGRVWAINYVYDASNLGKPGMATQGELDMLRRMPTTLPKDAVVLGDPIAGAAYTEVIGQREAVFPQLYHTMANIQDQDVLLQEFDQININPAVCEVLVRNNIQYFYQDEDGWYYNFERSERAPALYRVDTSQGFELIDQGDSVKLWKITACDYSD